MGEGDGQTPEGRDLSISLAQANVRTLAISLPLVGVMLAIHLLLAPENPRQLGMSLCGGLVFLLLMIAGIVVHEGIHALAWAVFGRLPLNRLRFGVHAATLTPYAHALDPMPARAYRLGALMPALVLGVIPFAVGTAIGSALLSLYGVAFAFAAGGDLLVLWLIRGVDPHSLVLDHPSRAGCIVLPPRPQ